MTFDEAFELLTELGIRKKADEEYKRKKTQGDPYDFKVFYNICCDYLLQEWRDTKNILNQENIDAYDSRVKLVTQMQLYKDALHAIEKEINRSETYE